MTAKAFEVITVLPSLPFVLALNCAVFSAMMDLEHPLDSAVRDGNPALLH